MGLLKTSLRLGQLSVRRWIVQEHLYCLGLQPVTVDGAAALRWRRSDISCAPWYR